MVIDFKNTNIKIRAKIKSTIDFKFVFSVFYLQLAVYQ